MVFMELKYVKLKEQVLQTASLSFCLKNYVGE